VNANLQGGFDPLALVKAFFAPPVRTRLPARVSPRLPWHRLVWLLAQPLGLLDIASSGCLAACFAWGTTGLRLAAARGTTRLRLAAARGTTRPLSPAPGSLRHWACTPAVAPPVPVCLLGAPPTGGTHLESNGGHWVVRARHLLRLANYLLLRSRSGGSPSLGQIRSGRGCLCSVLVLHFFLPPPGGLCGRGWSPLGGGHSGDAFWRDARLGGGDGPAAGAPNGLTAGFGLQTPAS
jgi:hypothetical protein